MKGFTVVELLIVIGILAVIGSFTFPIGITFFRSQILDEIQGGLLSSVRSAEMSAMTAEQASSFGIKILEHSYVIFRGESYAERIQEDDLETHLPLTLSVTGPEEIVFDPGSGIPSVSGTFLLTYFGEERAVHVNERGVIERSSI